MATIGNDSAFILRFWVYLKERFPPLSHGILVATFSFSAISYSRICRGAEGFISLPNFLVCAFTTITLFFLVRVFDEFKDAKEDAEHRSHLPIPRGLISLKEIGIVGAVVFAAQLIVNLIFIQDLLLIYAIVMLYLLLMGKEFFIGRWLKKHPFFYITSHMFIIPLIDIYASGFDWELANVAAPIGLIFFFIVSYMNGIVLEIGRKIKSPENEEHNTYSTSLGMKKASLLYIMVLIIALASNLLASHYAGFGMTGYLIVGSLFFLCLLAPIFFLQKFTKGRAKLVELSSALWTIGSYLTLGGVPMLLKFFDLL